MTARLTNRVRRFKTSLFVYRLVTLLLVAAACGVASAFESGSALEAELGSEAVARAPKAARKSSSTKKSEHQNTFEAPDFAFPQTVAKNAADVYRKSVAKSDWLPALKAAIQLDIADGEVSADSYAASIARFDSLANVAPAPYNALAWLLEARVYADIYNSQPWTFNQRTIPDTPVPANVMEWSTPMFANRVTELVGKALGADVAPDMKIRAIRDLLTDTADAESLGYTVADFISQQAIDLLSGFSSQSQPEIPFDRVGDRSPSAATAISLMTGTVDAAIARNAARNNEFVEALFRQMKLDQLQGSDRNEYLKDCYEAYRKSPAGALFVARYADTLSRSQAYKLLTEYAAEFPEAPQIGIVQAAINSLSARNLNITFAKQMLPGRRNPVTVKGSNVYDFYILVYKPAVSEEDTRVTYASLATLKPIHAVHIHIDGATPDRIDTIAMIPALQPGIYAFVPSTTLTSTGWLETDRKVSVNKTRVSSISVITNSEAAEDGKSSRYLYVVSAENMKPVAGAKVTLYEMKNGKRVNAEVHTTDHNGRLPIDNNQYYYTAAVGADVVEGRIYRIYESAGNERETLHAGVLTDLSIYHAGDTVRFESIAYTSAERRLHAAAGRAMTAYLVDANSQRVDTLQLTTDSFGRADGAFVTPGSGLLGYWRIEVCEEENWLGSASFQISDYKSPTFYVTVDSSSDTFSVGDDLQFKGRAVTYAGMPVAGGKVSYTIRYQPVWWLSDGGNATYGDTATTGDDGSFVISLPTKRLEGTRYARGGYRLEVAVTNGAGESQQAPVFTFALGNALRITSEVPDKVEVNGDRQSFAVRVIDLAGHPVVRTVWYELSRDGKTAASGSFESPAFDIDLSAIPSGRYRLRFALTPDFEQNDESVVTTDSVTIWRADDRKPPVATPLWLPRREVTVPVGAKSVSIPVGSSYDNSHMLVQMSDSRHTICTKWLEVNDGVIQVDVPAPAENDRISVMILACHDLDFRSETVTVIPFEQTVALKIETETFRDKIEPGASQTWRFRFSCDGKTCPQLPAMAVMTNKALNAITPFGWSFNPAGNIYYPSGVGRIGFNNNYTYSNSVYVQTGNKPKEVKNFVQPEWNTYGYPLYGGNMRYGMIHNSMLKLRSSNSVTATAGASADDMVTVTEAEVSCDMEAPESAMAAQVTDYKVAKKESVEESADAEEGGSDRTPLRDVECPLAFFMPQLVTDGDGVATLSFTAPEFVGTWQLQVGGYTPDMKGSVIKLDVVSAKKVMAQLNAPRFMRTGDVVSVAATLYNNSDSIEPLGGRIELLEASSGRVLTAGDFAPEDVRASGSRVVSVMMAVPADADAVIIRAYASVPGHRDGEQAVVQVLPSSTPVTESTPFYIPASEKDFELKLPVMDKDANVTLTYCDNPVWECVTALPSMLRAESVNTLAHAYALFGNAVASGLFNKYPALADGVLELAADSALVSPLQRDTQLKNVLLNNTPWVNSAAAETQRMESLVDYADKTKSAAAVADMFKSIADAQNPDGGWSWCPEMKSSTFITGRVLHVLASLRDMDCLPEGGRQMAERAFKFMDNEFADSWNKSKREYLPELTLLGYLYDKSSFGGVGSTTAFKPLEVAAMKAFRKNWRNYDVADKATAAMLFERSSEPALARTLLESLRQFASVSPQRGMWFDNLKGVFISDGPLLATARVLEAYALIEPQSPDVDLLRQWLVISKQTQNWGDHRCTAEAIHALLTTGSDWTAASSDAVVTLDGKPVVTGSRRALTGSFTATVDAAEASGATLRVSRTASSPAWGGVVEQYVAPILEVKSASVPQLSVEKNAYVVTTGASGALATDGEYTVGDLVRVTLTITCDRDLEYVSVVDSRAACLEPVNQLSGYTSTDGVWYYRETRNACTNLFIPFLSKGTHVISYDCRIDRTGDYSLGVADVQSQYAPEITAHSAGRELKVR